MAGGWIIVLDIGKSFSKASLWDEAGLCVAQRARANPRLESADRMTLDFSGIERWLREILPEFAKMGPVGAIVPVAHGAAMALMRNGQLLEAPLDYEWTGVATQRAAYDLQRDPFIATGSPALPAGLNLGMQLHWLESTGSAGAATGQIVPWPQYWGLAPIRCSLRGSHQFGMPYRSVATLRARPFRTRSAPRMGGALGSRYERRRRAWHAATGMGRCDWFIAKR